MRTLDSITEVMSPEQQVFVALELTKMHETHYRGKIADVMEQITLEHDDRRIKGEVTIVIGPSVSR